MTNRPPHRYGASRDVPIAEFLYRHEAEFAAGFLRSAEIPFRLQVDDAGGADAGVTIARPAVLWVRAEDAEEAREILGLDGPASDSAVGPAGPALPGVDERGTGSGRPPAAGSSGRRPHPPGPLSLEPLCRSERIVAGLAAGLLVALAAAGGEGAVPWVGVWESIALVLALVLGLGAASGRTFAPVKSLLRALSGFAP